MGALDELLSRWRSNPDADATIALCSYLGTSSREELIQEVSTSAETWHLEDGNVMLAVGRMHLDAGLLAESQAALVAAGKANGRDAKVFRYLGEVLLRRGDAVRAEKVLARALQFSPKDVEARLWHDRAALYGALQARIGVEAVAAEVRRTMPKQLSIPAPTLQPRDDRDFAHEQPTKPRQPNLPVQAMLAELPNAPEALPRFESEDPLRVSESDLIEDPEPVPIPTAARVVRATRLGMGPPGPRLPGVDRPHRSADSPERFEDVVTTVTPAPFIAPSWPEAAPASSSPAAFRTGSRSAPINAPPRGARAAAETVEAGPFMPPPPAPWSPFSFAADAPPTASPAPLLRADGEPPTPGVVLEHLSRVGVYEPGGGAPPAWENPVRQKTRGTWAIGVAIVLITAAGVTSYEYSKQVHAQRLAHAAALNAEVSKLLETGSVSDLRQTDQKLNASFELDSLSPRAARLWLQNRVLYQLLTNDDVRGIDSAVHRGSTVDLPEKETAFGRIASFMAEGDLAGGAATLSRWDAASGRDPYYQLVAGAVLERAGDLRAVERYEAARRLDPAFIPAQLLLARLLLLEFGPERAKPEIERLHQELGDAPITRALAALSWVVDPDRAETIPEQAKLQSGDADKLPAPLSSVPSMVEAVQAMRDGDLAKVSRAIDSAVMSAMTPSLATGLGFLAIEAGDEALARKAALRALQFAAVYPRARTLAARVALLGGRLDEAQKAIEELDPTAPDVALVRGLVAYESLEPSDLERALRSLGEAVHTRQTYTALAAGPAILTGRSFPSPENLEVMANPATPWGAIIAADAALDVGDLALATKILSRRSGVAIQPVHQLRFARLYRYQNKNDEALKAAAAAREGSTTAPVLIESVYAFVKNEDAVGATHLVSKYPTLLGPLTGWLNVLVDVANKQKSAASARAAKLDLPPTETPLELRVLVARALAASGDKRALKYVLALAKQVPRHPDVLEAALELR